jgi:ketosteroid isomerase-like protein
VAARTRDGRRYDSDYAGVFRVVNGQLSSVTEYLDTAYASNVLFGSGGLHPTHTH